jgi:mannose-6-phosphate isomerase-like protein (cupin superfamily)
MINIVKYENVPIADTPHQVDVRQLYETGRLSINGVKLGHGQGLQKHEAPVDVFIYILEGHGAVEIGDEQAHVSQDMLIQAPKGVAYTVLNDGDEPLRFLVIKMSPPDAK